MWSLPSSENGDDTDPILLPISGSPSSSSSTSPSTDRLELEAAELRNYMARIEGSQDIIEEAIPQIPWTLVGRKAPSLVWESSKQAQVLNQSLGEIQCSSIGGDIISSPKASTNCTETEGHFPIGYTPVVPVPARTPNPSCNPLAPNHSGISGDEPQSNIPHNTSQGVCKFSD